MFNPETKVSPQRLLVLIGVYNVWYYVLFEHNTFADIAMRYYTAIHSFFS